MDEKIYLELITLKEMLNNSKEAQELNKMDSLINSDASFKILSMKVKEIKEEYDRYKKILKEDDITLINIQKNYSNLKKELDLHPLTIKYMEAYKKVRDIYQYINHTLFDRFIDKKCC